MKLDKIVFYRLRSCSWTSPWTEHANIVTSDGMETTASLFYAQRLLLVNATKHGQYTVGLPFTHELNLVDLGIFLRFSGSAIQGVVHALAMAGYFREDGQ